MLMLPFDAQGVAPSVLVDRPSPSVPPRWELAMRAFDVVVAAILLLLLLPLFTLVAVLVAAGDGKSPLFAQQRLGQHGRLFACWKFRTMVPDAHRHLPDLLAGPLPPDWLERHKLTHDPRITPIGRLLRRTSLDELPQLANVLLGHMSLVGARPIVASEVARYGRHFADYCRQRPGISGLWQVSGRSATTYRRRLACDRLFVRRRSLALYARILLATIPAVLFARGAC